ncbi:MAG: 4'-phosphopantetheinyl transferase family protein [Gammaproteobacteria bacterium]
MDLILLDAMSMCDLLSEAATGKWNGRDKCEPPCIKLWTYHVPTDIVDLQPYLALLSYLERERAKRFCFESHRAEFVIARALLRMALGRELGCHARELDFNYGQFGKPSLVTVESRDGIEFNLSHSHGMIVIAWGRSIRIGVDVEKVKEIFDHSDITRKCFSTKERQLLEASDIKDHGEIFFSLWTAKEAYSKALGIGVSYPLEKIDCVALALKCHGIYRSAMIGNGRDKSCVLQFKPMSNYIASVVVNNAVDQVVWRRVF